MKKKDFMSSNALHGEHHSILTLAACAAAVCMLSLHANAQTDNGHRHGKKHARQERVDTATVVAEHKENRNIMANAGTLDQPRDLDTGLGASATPTTIYEDGIPVSYATFPVYANQHWRPGSAIERQYMLGLAESAVRTGAAGYVMETYALKGADHFQGQVNIRLSSRHQQTYDGSLALPLGKGWSTAVAFLQDYNQGYTKLKITPMQGRQKMIQWGLKKTFDRGNWWFTYKYTDDFQNMDAFAPCLYHINGKVSLMDGFKVGRDTYLPDDMNMTYLNIKTGKMESVDVGTLGSAWIHDVQTGFEYNLGNSLTLTGSLKWMHASEDKSMANLMGQGEAKATSGFTYTDGTLFTGQYQTRNVKREMATVNDFLGTFELNKKTSSYEWTLGFNEWNSGLDFVGSSAIIAQELTVNPRRLYLNGQSAWTCNIQGEFTNGHENRAAFYWMHHFHITPKWDVHYGARLEDKYINVFAPFNNEGETVNSRKPGFSMASPGAYVNHKHYNWVVPTATLYTSYTLNKHWLVSVDGTYILGRKTLHNWGNSDIPNTDASANIFASAGVSYRNAWMDWASKVSYMRMTNQVTNLAFSKNFDGYAASAQPTIIFDKQSISWVNDANFHPWGGFNFHVRLLLNKPTYPSMKVEAYYDNGVEESYDYSGNEVSGTSKVQLELDPSYRYKQFAVSFNARYYSKQYVNYTNSLTLAGRWETFADVKYELNKHISFDFNIVNPLNQKGISGRVNGADTAEKDEIQQFDGQFMAGQFIIPRTFLFTTSIKI